MPGYQYGNGAILCSLQLRQTARSAAPGDENSSIIITTVAAGACGGGSRADSVPSTLASSEEQLTLQMRKVQYSLI